MSFNFEDVQEDQSFGASVAYKAYIEPWAKVFGFEYDDDFEPKEPEPSIPQSQEGVYRTATTEKFTQPKPNVYKGIGTDGRFIFEFTEPLFANTIHARLYKGFGLNYGQINIYPPYIYATLKVILGNESDAVLMKAVSDLDTIITRQDMNFTDENKHLGYSYKYDCPFYLSFLKTQVIILLVNSSIVINASQKAENKSEADFGAYCPYYEIAGFYHPAILLDLNAIRRYAAKEKQNVKGLYMQILLKLLAYAYQDPTNSVDEAGTFEKMTKPKKSEFSFAYNEEEAAELAKNYLSYS